MRPVILQIFPRQRINRMYEFIKLTPENIDKEHLCCIIRTQKPHVGVETKRAWLSKRIREGHVFCKLNIKGCVFIEYAPLESAWVPILGDNFCYIYCLWIQGQPRGHGYGRRLMEYCIDVIAIHRALYPTGPCKWLIRSKEHRTYRQQVFSNHFFHFYSASLFLI